MELPDEDRPPEGIWLDSEAVSEHFEGVRQRYSSGKGGSGGQEPVPQLDQNELTRDLR